MTRAVRPLGGPEQSAEISGDVVGVLNRSGLMKGRLGAWRASINSQRYFSLPRVPTADKIWCRLAGKSEMIQYGSESLAAQ